MRGYTGLFLLFALALLAPVAGRADTSLAAQGTGTMTLKDGSLTLTCKGPIVVAFAQNTTGHHLIEAWGPGSATSSSADSAVSCAVDTLTSVDVVSGSLPNVHQCVAPVQGPTGKIVLPDFASGPYSVSGSGTSSSPYVVQYAVTLCDGTKYLDKITFTTSTTMSYAHDILINNIAAIHVTASLARIA